MRYLTKFGVIAIAMAALMAFIDAGTASATILTNAQGGQYGVGTTFDLKSEGKVVFGFGLGKLECESTVRGQVTNAGGATSTVSGPIENNLPGEPLFSECNGVVETVAKGILEIHTQEANANFNGTLTSTGLELTTEFATFHCIFRTNGTDLGTVTGSTGTGGKATVDIKATLPRTGGRSGAFCGSSVQLTGSYVVESPAFVDVD